MNDQDYKLLWHMFSLDLDAFNFYKNDAKDSNETPAEDEKFNDKYYSLANGFNIIIIEKTVLSEREDFNILIPKRANHYNKTKNTIFLYKQQEYFEPIIFRTLIGVYDQGGLKETNLEVFNFSQEIKYNKINFTEKNSIMFRMIMII